MQLHCLQVLSQYHQQRFVMTMSHLQQPTPDAQVPATTTTTQSNLQDKSNMYAEKSTEIIGEIHCSHVTVLSVTNPSPLYYACRPRPETRSSRLLSCQHTVG